MRCAFSDFVLDTEQRQLWRSGCPIHLTPKAWQLLLILVESRPQVLSKNEIYDRLWPDTYVSESNLASLVAELRRKLVDDSRKSRFIRTVHGFGYAFSGDVAEDSRPLVDPHEFEVSLFEPDGHEHVLRSGDNLVGRDPAADVRLDDHTVSRRHARIRIYGGCLTVEDLASKNGTAVNRVKVHSGSEFHDGDVLAFGSVELAVRTKQASTTTLHPAAEDSREAVGQLAEAAALAEREP